MNRFTTVWILTVFMIFSALTSNVPADLIQYVKAEDPVYKWEKLSQTDLHNGAVLYELKLVSQVWQGITWQHTLRIIKPKEVRKIPTLALLLIGAGTEREGELIEGMLMANQIGAPVAIIHDIPNQPLFGGLKEDDLVAYSFLKFTETNDSTWPILLPMVKGSVRAMDAVQEFMQSELDVRVSGFLVSGSSKRGWTTWLTSVVDKRVRAIAPMVYDNLNLPDQMKYQVESWGRFSEEISEYTDQGLPQRLLTNEKALEVISNIVDPFVYRNRISIPKLIIIGTNDRYWPLDALNLYYKELIGETHILYVPNVGHNLEPGRVRALESLMAFFLKTDGSLKFPKLAWELKEKYGMIDLTITSDIKPLMVRAWTAKSQTKDFRDAEWEAFDMKQEDSIYTHTLEKPAEGYAALFGEAVYFEGGRSFFLSTNVEIFQPTRQEKTLEFY